MRFLASVRNPEEAEIVIGGGADLVDLKDPAKGALGAVSPDVLAATMNIVAGRRPVSAVAGDLPMEPALVLAEVAARSAADYVKVGLFPAPKQAREAVVEALGAAGHDTALIAVFFADGDPDFSLLPALAEAGFAGAMIDTMGKSEGRLLSHLSIGELGDFVRRAKALGLMTGLAGSLEAPDIPRLAVLEPDYLGFRGALTGSRRDAPVEPSLVRSIGELVARDGAVRPVEGPGDRVFVRNYTLPLEIGAYGFERGRRQDVSFSVEAEIEPIAVSAETVGDVYSYDLILDAIRTLAGRGHTDLVERLALDLAEMVLADGRIRVVTVTVEKLELGPEAVGVSVTRRRSPP